MEIQFNTDNTIESRDELARRVEDSIAAILGRFGEKMTRVEARLSDISTHKMGQADIRCLLEARLAGRKPVAVSHRDDSVEQAVTGAAEKLKRALESTFGRLENR